MKRGPASGRVQIPVSVANLTAAWGNDAPDWLRVLAEACDATSQSQVAKRIGYTNSMISSLLKDKYRGDLCAVEKAVRGALMAEKLRCPGLGQEIATNTCLDWQKRARKLSAANPLNVQMFRACRGDCPHSRIGAKGV